MVCVTAVIKNGNGFSARKAALLCAKPTKVRTSQLKGGVKITPRTPPATRGNPRLVFEDMWWKGHPFPPRLPLPSLYRPRRLESRWWLGPTRCDTPTRLPARGSLTSLTKPHRFRRRQPTAAFCGGCHVVLQMPGCHREREQCGSDSPNPQKEKEKKNPNPKQ